MAYPIILPLKTSGTSIRFSGVGHESRFQGVRGPVKCSQLAQNIMNRANPIIVPLPTYGTSMGAFTFRFSGVGHKSRSRGGRFKCSSLNSDVEKLRQEFLEVLGRNRIPVTLTVEPKPAPVIDPNVPVTFCQVWDLIKLADYLTQQRDDVDSARIGIMGISLGGMHSWFAAFADTRYAVAVPIIGVQGFQWAIDNDQWQARVDSIKPVFEVARVDLGKDEIDSEVVGKVWDRIAPGLRSDFDAPNSVPAIAPRPLLIMNGEDDPRCPIRGLDVPVSNAKKAYKEAGYGDQFKFISELGVGHNITASMMEEASKWFDRFLYR